MNRKKYDVGVAGFWNAESAQWAAKHDANSSYFYRRQTFCRYLRDAGQEISRILDYGCGSGDVTFPMLYDGYSVVGVDIAENMIRLAEARAKEEGFLATATYHVMDDKVLAEIEESKFDAVVCSSVLEYVDDDMELIRLFHSVLTNAGLLIVSVPDRRSLFCKLDKWMYRHSAVLKNLLPVERLGYLEIQKRQYDVGRFIKMVESVGFTLLEKKYHGITKQRGIIMEKVSNIPCCGMLCITKFRKNQRGPAK